MRKLLIALLIAAALAPAAQADRVRVSWYSMGHTTANGQPYRPDRISCAHKHLPFGTKVKFTFNGRSIIAVVNDRGPFIKGRTYDLSRGAARALGILHHGVATVDAVVLGRRK